MPSLAQKSSLLSPLVLNRAIIVRQYVCVPEKWPRIFRPPAKVEKAPP